MSLNDMVNVVRQVARHDVSHNKFLLTSILARSRVAKVPEFLSGDTHVDEHL